MKSTQIKCVRWLPLIALCIITACATSQKAPEPSNGQTAQSTKVGDESSFEISYWLGEHGEHQLKGSFAPTMDKPHVATYLEHEVVEENLVQPEKYNRFIAKVLLFVQRSQRAPSAEHECRSPYAITLKIDGKTMTSKGCREGEDDTLFGKIVREGEFLLYSKK